MTNTYRALSPQAEAVFQPGVFEADFTVMDEKDHLDNGILELVPRTYRVLSDNFSGGPQNSTYDATFRREIEQALIQGSHIERVDPPAAAPVEVQDAPPVDDVPVKKTK